MEEVSQEEKKFINKTIMIKNHKLVVSRKKFQKYVCQEKETFVKTDICDKTE